MSGQAGGSLGDHKFRKLAHVTQGFKTTNASNDFFALFFCNLDSDVATEFFQDLIFRQRILGVSLLNRRGILNLASVL